MWFIILSVLLTACSSELPYRNLASTNTLLVLGEIDYQKSSIQVFHSGSEDQGHYLYVQLKNKKGDFVDCEKDEFHLKTPTGDKVGFYLHRKLRGRYYLMMEKGKDLTEVVLLIKGMPLPETFKISQRAPHALHTKMMFIQKTEGKLFLRLKLADKTNRFVESPEIPEIIMEGEGFIQDLKYIGEGNWDFTVAHPGENQLMYFSVRYMGLYFPNLYRHQHVDK
jgi:hypothetical protein